jgi:Ser/Thr protein kinase RdoA (MazF antagonist)
VWPGEVTLETVDGGLINETWWVRDAAGSIVAVLQWLNTAVFVPAVHEDIEAVTAHLARRGISTPRLLRTRAGALWHTTPSGDVFRCLTPIGDRTVDKLQDPADAFSAGRLVASFHGAVRDLEWTFRGGRVGVHDTERHMERLRAAVARETGHRLHRDVAPAAETIHSRWTSWRGARDLPERIVHGDLKVSNVRFEGRAATALIDLDTVGRGTLDAELGDAFRSWCNPEEEDAPSPHFSQELFAAAIEGYAAGAARDGPTDAEWAAIVPGIERIALELAARFAVDALEERYFGYDAARFATRGEHNLVRARNQLALAVDARRGAPAASAALARARRLAG